MVHTICLVIKICIIDFFSQLIINLFKCPQYFSSIFSLYLLNNFQTFVLIYFVQDGYAKLSLDDDMLPVIGTLRCTIFGLLIVNYIKIIYLF